MKLDRLRRLSLEGLLAWGFGSLIVGGVVAALLAVAAWRIAVTSFAEYETRDAPDAQLASEGVYAWAEVRQLEESMLRPPAGSAWSAEASARYLSQWKAVTDDVRNHLIQIEQLAGDRDREIAALLPEMKSSLVRYTTSFSSAVDLTVRLGGPDSGLDATLRATDGKAEAILARVNAPALFGSLRTLRGIRMGLTPAGMDASAASFGEEAARFELLAARAPQSRALTEAIWRYRASFGEYVRLAKELEAKRHEVSQTATLLETAFQRLKHAALQRAHVNLLATVRRIVGATLTAAIVALIAVLLGTVIAVVAGRRIRVAARRVIGFAAHVAAGRLQTRLDGVDHGEFGALESALNTMADRLEQNDELMNRQARALESRNDRTALLSQMTGLLQAAVNLDEATDITAQYLTKIRLARSGAVYLYTNESRTHLRAIARWGDASASDGFDAASCWALRRGLRNGFGETSSAAVCAHAVSESENTASLCLPLLSSEGMLGLVYVVFDELDPVSRGEDVPFATRLSEQLGLAFANLKLRETLQAQLIRDPLTKLFNRRVLDESLPREIARAERANESVAVLMIDADHFKQFNDQHGHQAGDAALLQIGRVLLDNCRAGDFACRYGGEEFTVVLPRTGHEGAEHWARRLGDKIRKMKISLDGVALPSLTVSIGGALYPEHGDDAATVLGAADQALYQAKRAGRDCVVIEAAKEAESVPG